MRLRSAGLPLLFILGMLFAPLAAEAQQAGTVYRIGFLTLWYSTSDPTQRLAFVEGLRTLGYREGQNLAFENRYADSKVEQLPALANALVNHRVDVIVASSTRAGLAAKQATSTIPIVIVGSDDMIGSGLVTSVSRPSGNVTGFQFLSPELAVRQVEILKQVSRGAGRLALLGDPDRPSEILFFRSLERQARSLSVTVRFVEARTAGDQQTALATIAREGVDGLIVAASAIQRDPERQIVRLTALHRIPTIYPGRQFVEAGGLISYFTDLAEQARRAAVYVDRILKGAKPAGLPVEQPTKFELVINVKTAKTLGLTIPQPLLLRADEVIQ